MATITTNQYLDDAARTAGETFTINGATLTIRTDTRVHANAPAGMTGSIGNITLSSTQVSKFFVDSSKVRELSYNSGTGNVPAIGATISQGGVSGYLLGVYANATSAPTTAGSAMPASGFIKFREVTGGAFSAGALTGIGASATGADRIGWIEIVADQSTSSIIPGLGTWSVNEGNSFYWYDLGTTTGTAGQVIQIPTNGGGTGTQIPAVEIETSAGSGVYEKFPALLPAIMTTTNLGTDARSEFVCNNGNGQIIIGNNGTVNVGYLPPAGCKIRVPNVFLRQTSSANRTLNLAPHNTVGSRPTWSSSSQGEIKISGVLTDWNTSFYFIKGLTIDTLYGFDAYVLYGLAGTHNANNMSIVGNSTTNNRAFDISFCGSGGTVSNSKFYRTLIQAGGLVSTVFVSPNVTLTNVEQGVVPYGRSSNMPVQIASSDTTKMIGCRIINTAISTTSSSNCTITNLDYSDVMVGATTTVQPLSTITFGAKSNNFMVDGLTFGLNGTVSNVQPYAAVFSPQAVSNLTIRNIGTVASPLSLGTANKTGYFIQDNAGLENMRIQRCYITDARTEGISPANISISQTVQNFSTTAGGLGMRTNGLQIKGARVPNILGTFSGLKGSHFANYFTTDTVGTLQFVGIEPNSLNADYVTNTLGAGAVYTATGSLLMPNIGDTTILETPYYVLGYTSFQNVAPTTGGALPGNFSFEYQIDTGSGTYSSWKTLNATNLSGETISPSTGFRLKFKATVITANATNSWSSVTIPMNTTLSAQSTNLYPLDYATISLTGLVAGSLVEIYNVNTSTTLFVGNSATSTLTQSVPFTSAFTCRIRIMYMSGVTAKKFIEFTENVTASGFSRSIAQEDDEVYNANAIDGSTITGITINDSLMLINVNTPTLSCQQLYAYETYWLSTNAGIIDESRIIEAVDRANYKFTGFKIKNTGSGPLTITGGYPVDSVTGQAIDLIDNTGGTIIVAPDHVVALSTNSTTVTKDDLRVINRNVQKGSLLIPATETL